jgi:hypothetical protein
VSECPHGTNSWNFNSAGALLERRPVSSGDWKLRLIIVATTNVPYIRLNIQVWNCAHSRWRVRRHCTYFNIISSWPLLHCHDNETDRCSVNHLVSEYRTTMGSIRSVKQISTKPTFLLWSVGAHTVIFPKISLMQFYFRDVISSNYRNIINTVRAIFENILLWEAHLSGTYFGD